MKITVKNRKVFTGISLVVILFIYLILFQKNNFPKEFESLTIYSPLYSYTKYPLPLMIYSNIPIKEILKNKKIFKEAHVTGFIIATSKEDALEKHYWDYLKLNWSFPENYLEINIADKDTPNWDDIPNWASFNNRIKALAKFAKRTGFKGLSVNTYAYDKSFWNPEYDNRYKTISDDFASKVIYQRSREMIQGVESVFPQSKIIITPLGALTPTKSYQLYSDYEYWTHFVNGLFSTKHSAGFTFIIDDVQFKTEDIDFQNTALSTNMIISTNIDEKTFWQKTGVYNFVVEPTFERYNNSIENQNFIKQVFLAEKYSQQKTLIRLFNKEEYLITSQDMKSALSVMPKIYSPYTKGYFQSVQTGKKTARINILGYKLERLFK